MKRQVTKRLLPVVVILFAMLAVLSVPARAESVQDVASALRTSPVFQQAGVDLLDVAAVKSAIDGNDPQVYVAALTATAAASDTQARARAIDIGSALGDTNAVVLVITANHHLGAAEGNGAYQRGVRAPAALVQQRRGMSGFDKSTVTTLATGFARQVDSQAANGPGTTGRTSTGTTGSSSGSHTGAYLLGGLALVGGGLVLRSKRRTTRRRAQRNEELRADVEQLYNRLGNDVSTLAAGDNTVARQAMADASERYNATGSVLATADSDGEFAAARRSAIEGLTAAQTARKALGLDAGPELPALQGEGPHLSDDERIRVGDQEYDGSPSYRPGRGHYFEGGRLGGQMVPGGWYSAPFWTPFLLGSVLSGGFGGGGLFGGYGGGYDNGGFERGYEAGQDDSGNAGGGSWGGGGGDFGGGGGDWGGGGGDMGGGGGGDW